MHKDGPKGQKIFWMRSAALDVRALVGKIHNKGVRVVLKRETNEI
jgi:hypothetical protein